MVYTSNAVITAILAVSAAAPILAAPVEPRIVSGFSSMNNRAPVPRPSTQPPVAEPEAVPAPAPEVAGKETSSNVSPAVLNHHLAAREVEVEAGVKTGPAQSGELLQSSPIAQGLLGRTALAAISSILHREAEFAGAITGGAAAASGASFASTNNLIQHFNRASAPSAIPDIYISPAQDESTTGGAALPGPSTLEENWNPLAAEWAQSGSPSSVSSGTIHSASGSTNLGDFPPEFRLLLPSPPSTPLLSTRPPSTPPPSTPPESTADETTPLLPPSESTPSTPSTGIVSKLTSLVNTPAKAIGTGLTFGGVVSAAAYGAAKLLGHRDLDADTLHLLGRDLDTDTLRLLLGRDLEDLFARSFSIDELD